MTLAARPSRPNPLQGKGLGRLSLKVLQCVPNAEYAK